MEKLGARVNVMYIAPFVASPLSVIRRLLTMAELKPGEVVYDLGLSLIHI